MNQEGATIQRGPEAGLSMVRVSSAEDNDTLVTALEQALQDGEQILLGALSGQYSFSSSPPPEVAVEAVPGYLVVTSERLLLWPKRADATEDDDLGIPSTCIDLHALAEASVYIQITSKQDNYELSVLPSSSDQIDTIFSSLSQLVSLHPVDPNETEDGMMMTGDDADDGMIWAPPVAAPMTNTTGEATEEERNAMLEHLDNILVVPPELEQDEQESDDEAGTGQFDDAEDDSDIL